MQWTVLTGDIIASSEIAPARLDAAFAELASAARDIDDWITPGDDPIQTGFARRGGDGWQFAANRVDYGLRTGLFLRARLRAFGDDVDTRIAVAVGEGTAKPGQDLNSAHGPAFTASGRLIDDIHGRAFMAHASGGLLDATYRLADHISQGWTQAQARAIGLKLPPLSGANKEIGDTLGISRQAVDQSLASAGYYAIASAIDATEIAAGSHAEEGTP